MSFPVVRMRRLRQNKNLRQLLCETEITKEKLIQPIFIRHGHGHKIPISSMPGVYQFSLDQLPEEISLIQDCGIKTVILFGIPENKSAKGDHALLDNGIIQQAIALIKKLAPELTVISDLCFCEYTDHGHCGIIHNKANHFEVLNDETVFQLGVQAVSHARAGVDILAPSGAMDGMVQGIRKALDEAGFHYLPILSYSVKYASSFYSPFREAAQGAPQFGDRRTYQMNTANSNEALRECALDILEGADMLMVKPAHTYLDIIYKIKQRYPELPLCAYHTSGEYSMIKAASKAGWLNEKETMLEVLTAIKRAGADFIISYFAKDVAQL